MSNVDLSRLITAQDRATRNDTARAARIKAACAARITAVLDDRTLLNIQGAAILGTLKKPDMDVFRAGRGWIAAMQAECRRAIAAGDSPSWPEAPAGLSDLADAF